MSGSKIYFQYIRQEDRRPIGLLCAQVVNAQLRVGLALESRPKYWNKKMGRNVAIGRMHKCDTDFFEVVAPASRYFDTDLSIEMPEGFGIDEQIDSFIENCVANYLKKITRD